MYAGLAGLRDALLQNRAHFGNQNIQANPFRSFNGIEVVALRLVGPPKLMCISRPWSEKFTTTDSMGRARPWHARLQWPIKG